MAEEDFFRLVFVSILSIQYHPRNDVTADQDDVIIRRALDVSLKAVRLYSQIVSDDIPF